MYVLDVGFCGKCKLQTGDVILHTKTDILLSLVYMVLLITDPAGKAFAPTVCSQA